MKKTVQPHRQEKSRRILHRMAAAVAVALAAAICYTATVFAWFNASIVNSGSTITSAGFGMDVTVTVNGQNRLPAEVKNALYLDQSFQVPLVDGQAELVLTIAPSAGSALFRYDWQLESGEGVTLTQAHSSGTVDRQGTVFRIGVAADPAAASASVRLSGVASYQGNQAQVRYIRTAEDWEQAAAAGGTNCIYFLLGNMTLTQPLNFTGEGSFTLILNGYELRVPSLTVEAQRDRLRFASFRDGKLTLGGETLRDNSRPALAVGAGEVRVTLSGLTDQAKPDLIQPAESAAPLYTEPDSTEPAAPDPTEPSASGPAEADDQEETLPTAQQGTTEPA